MGRKRAGSQYTRTNLSVPVSVKQQMDGAAKVNWSAVATEAFRKKLAELKNAEGVLVRPGTHW